MKQTWRTPRALLLAGAGAAAVALGGCGEAVGASVFALPPGDPAAGQVAFVDLKCTECHAVAGVKGLPAPAIDPPVPMLGGKVPSLPTETYLVASIVNPAHAVKRNFVLPVTADGKHTRMGDYVDRMTVRELVDLVAFLQPKYERRILW